MHRSVLGIAAGVLAVWAGCAAAQTPPPGGYTGPLFPTGEPVVTSGEIAGGRAIVTIPVRYSFTGVLEAPVRDKALFGAAKPLPAGQPMFAVIMGGRNTGTLRFWCTHRLKPLKSAPKNRETICLPKHPAGPSLWIESFSLLPSAMDIGQAHGSDEPQVKAGPADFGGQTTLSYRLVEFDAKDVDINLYLSIDGMESRVGQINLPRQPDGSVVMPLLGGTLRLTQNGKNRKSAAAEVIAPLSAASPDVMIFNP